MRSLLALSSAALLLANLFPIYGILYLHWDAYYLLWLYWFESVIVGVYTILKIVFLEKWASIISVFYFILVYGAFLFVHFILIAVIMGYAAEHPFFGDPRILPTNFVELLKPLYQGIIALFLSHGISFILYFFIKGEKEVLVPTESIKQAFERVLVMQVAALILFCIFFIISFPSIFYILVVLVKFFFDIKAHYNQHWGEELLPFLTQEIKK